MRRGRLMGWFLSDAVGVVLHWLLAAVGVLNVVIGVCAVVFAGGAVLPLALFAVAFGVWCLAAFWILRPVVRGPARR